MPLPPPDCAREHLHTRTVTCTGYRRTDGLWDIEGHITDQKTYGFDSQARGRLAPGDFVHDMWIRLTVDSQFVVQAVAAVTDASPFAMCPAITPNFQRLVGLRIASGWTAAVKERLGGIEGCTHLVELLGPVATTTFQTIAPVLEREARDRRKAAAALGEPPAPQRRPVLLNTCHSFASDSPVVKQAWPDFYTGPRDEAGPTGRPSGRDA
ncbi:DUF2889 domain-containing protein [Oleisolibacter albus]|uniref:DUF2889 domain-containing protein n=1 Tax=Oleisolibacter albus TaxID=2171757 RepID=UPI000DF1E6D3|nr:DUF2889 domain-containing protein [Oleisolibacter albus]